MGHLRLQFLRGSIGTFPLRPFGSTYTETEDEIAATSAA